MNWLVRTAGSAAVRKVVYFIVGLAIAWFVTTTGVGAASQTVNLTVGVVAGNGVTVHSGTPTGGGGVIDIHLIASGAAPGCLKIYVGGVLQTPRSEAGISGCHLFTSDGTYDWHDTGIAAGDIAIKSDNMGNLGIVTGSYFTYDDGVTPTPTPTATPTATPTPTPTPDPICDPYCEVALTDEDRDRLDALLVQQDDSTYIVVGGMGISVFLLTVLTVAAGLRR